jgi:hypothetical protein
MVSGTAAVVGIDSILVRSASPFTSLRDAPWLSPIECVTTGMAFLYFRVNATFVFELVPVPGMNQSWMARIKDWHALTELMAYRFSDVGSPSAVAFAICVFEDGILAINFIYQGGSQWPSD